MWKCWLHILWETILFFCRCRLLSIRQLKWPRTKQKTKKLVVFRCWLRRLWLPVLLWLWRWWMWWRGRRARLRRDPATKRWQIFLSDYYEHHFPPFWGYGRKRRNVMDHSSLNALPWQRSCAVGVKSSKATIKGKGDRKRCEDIWFQVFDTDIKAHITSYNATIKFKAKISQPMYMM